MISSEQKFLESARTPAAQLSGVLPKMGRLLHNIDIRTQQDIWFHLPLRLEAWKPALDIQSAPLDTPVMLRVQVVHHMPSEARTSGRKRLYRVATHDLSGALVLSFFNGRAAYLQKILPVHTWCYCLGTVTLYHGMRQMVHPDHIAPGNDPTIQALFKTNTPIQRLIYPSTAGLVQAVLRRIIHGSMERLPEAPEWLDSTTLAKHNWPSFKHALKTLHAPEAYGTPVYHQALDRLAYDELLAHQLLLGMTRGLKTHTPGIPLPKTPLCDAFLAALPFSLTDGQIQALKTIQKDLEGPHAMVRLLQGDVGSGKTVVALAALVQAIGAGYQGAFLAPTELLATQHLASLERFLKHLPIRYALLTGSLKTAQKRTLKEQLAAGEIDLLLGTHAIFEEDVIFKNLGCIIIDEQHRFGVDQRFRLTQKAPGVHALLMSATPIPRTLTLALYGDIDVTYLLEKPKGRQAITTRVLALERLDDVIASIGRVLVRGERIFWVCPLVSESEISDLANAKMRFESLQQHFGAHVGLAHGQMSPKERQETMEAFRRGDIQILVATSIIEVGVDVPEATVMVIEEAQRFGLAQLHQLRGRIGRGDKPGTCLLLYRSPLSEIAHGRLDILRTSMDGFKIAEKDLEIRGSGEILGTLQSGLPTFRFGTLSAHSGLLGAAATEARRILEQDPRLISPRGAALQILLQLFHAPQALAYLKYG